MPGYAIVRPHTRVSPHPHNNSVRLVLLFPHVSVVETEAGGGKVIFSKSYNKRQNQKRSWCKGVWGHSKL